MQVLEQPRFSTEYLEPDKRSIGNTIQLFFKDGTNTHEEVVDYPVGHRRRRAEGIPLLIEKFERYVVSHYGKQRGTKILASCEEQSIFEQITVDEMMQMLQVELRLKD